MALGTATPTAGPFSRSRAFGRVGGAVLLGLLILSCAALVGSAISFDRRVADVREASSDNQGWIVSQLEVDHLSLALASAKALSEAIETGSGVSDETWQTLITEFDIFYSRVTVFLASMRRFDVTPEFESRLSRLTRLRTELAANIDALERTDIAGLQAFDDALRNETDLIRGVVTTGLQFFVELAEDARERERVMWQFFLVQTLGLLALTVGAALLAARLIRALEHRGLAAERAASTIVKAYEAMLSAVIVTTYGGKVLLFNKSAEKMFRIAAGDVVGAETSMEFVPRRLRRFVQRTIDIAMQQAAPGDTLRISRRTLARRFDGEIFPIELSVTNDVDHDGSRILIAFIRDISSQVQAENAMRTAVDEARRAAAAKGMFLSTMSHEMRTPLHGLIAALELMDPHSFDVETRKLYDTALHCSDRALSQINDVLQFTRASALREEAAPFLPAHVAGDLLAQLGPYAQENGNAIELSISGAGRDTPVMGFPNSFSRALYNLIGNAAKFTRNGHVRVELTFGETGPDGDALTLRVAVTDDGPGIAEADHDRIFDLFETTADPTDATTNTSGQWGTGLGLPITRIAVETMNSQIRLDSSLGQGSRFWFDLVLPRAPESIGSPVAPAIAAVSADERAANECATGRLETLVVDDNEINRTLMVRMVERLGHRAASARNGREAMDMARASRFDVILMDVNMPIMNGCEASVAIREAGASREAVIIGVTALIEAEDAGLFFEYGMQTTLVKPVKPATLAATFEAIERGEYEVETLDMSDPVAEPELDAKGLAELVGAQTARRLLTATLDDAEAALEALRANSDTRRDLAHKAAGAASMVGWARLAEALRDVELMPDTGAPDTLGLLSDKLSARIADARAELATCEGLEEPEALALS